MRVVTLFRNVVVDKSSEEIGVVGSSVEEVGVGAREEKKAVGVCV